MPETSDRTIVITHVFDAPRAVVFDAWTSPEHVTHWWDPSGAPLAVCEIDLRPGGAFRWVNQNAHPFCGTYREISAPERLVFTARATPAIPESLATLLFAEQGQVTTLTMTIECASVADRDVLLGMRVDVGTGRTLANLATYLGTVASTS